MLRKAVQAVVPLMLLAGQATAAPDGNPPGTGYTPDQNVLGYVEQSTKLTQLLSLLELAGLTETLRGHGPITLLAPTNDAFAGLPPDMLANLQLPKNRAQLAAILGCHVIAGGVTLQTLAAAAAGNKTIPLTSVGGCRLTARAAGNGGVEIDDQNGIKAAVVYSDVPEANGVVQVIDGVLTPAIPR